MGGGPSCSSPPHHVAVHWGGRGQVDGFGGPGDAFIAPALAGVVATPASWLARGRSLRVSVVACICSLATQSVLLTGNPLRVGMLLGWLGLLVSVAATGLLLFVPVGGKSLWQAHRSRPRVIGGGRMYAEDGPRLVPSGAGPGNQRTPP